MALLKSSWPGGVGEVCQMKVEGWLNLVIFGISGRKYSENLKSLVLQLRASMGPNIVVFGLGVVRIGMGVFWLVTKFSFFNGRF